MIDFHGVYPILPTPFREDGSLDVPSIERLIDWVSATGIEGVSILGFLGEAQKLSSDERDQVISAVLRRRPKELKVLVGVRAFGAAGAAEMGKSARDQGADGLFVAPIPVQTNRALANFYRTVAAEVGLPVFIHDFPESFGVTVPAELVTELAQDDSQVVGIKLEEKPVLPKLSAIRAASAEFRIFGGLGGVYCLEELGRGASGIMTGFAFPQILVEIYNAYTSGDVQRATELFDRYATLLRYEFQPKIGLGFRKHLYWRRGVFETTTVRPPSPPVDDQSLKELDQIVERLGLTP